jgi:hypothetical protein
MCCEHARDVVEAFGMLSLGLCEGCPQHHRSAAHSNLAEMEFEFEFAFALNVARLTQSREPSIGSTVGIRVCMMHVKGSVQARYSHGHNVTKVRSHAQPLGGFEQVLPHTHTVCQTRTQVARRVHVVFRRCHSVIPHCVIAKE